MTTYNYDAVGNLQNFVYPNGVTHAYSYDPLNRPTQMGSSKNASSISNYAYTLGAAGNRTSVAELSGRTVAYAYDSLYRLTSETVSADPNNHNGVVSYTYDSVGNRKTLTSTLAPVGANTYNYDTDDRLVSDQYDADGNTTNSGGVASAYDFENHLITHGGVTIVYDGDGNRVSETVGSVTTNYLVDTQNPTGYAQVVDELVSGTVTRTYAYGLERISENQTISSTWTPSFYGYDGHGSVRQLFDSTGTITDSYAYDAFGNLISSTGSTPNVYLFAGEAYDAALGLYYNRARYLNTTTGRFWSMDTYEGDRQSPASLHKYLYNQGDPVDHVDPSGHQMLAVALAATFAVIALCTVAIIHYGNFRERFGLSGTPTSTGQRLSRKRWETSLRPHSALRRFRRLRTRRCNPSSWPLLPISLRSKKVVRVHTQLTLTILELSSVLPRLMAIQISPVQAKLATFTTRTSQTTPRPSWEAPI